MKFPIKVAGSDQKPHYARAKVACAHFQIARSTLWQCDLAPENRTP